MLELRRLFGLPLIFPCLLSCAGSVPPASTSQTRVQANAIAPTVVEASLSLLAGAACSPNIPETAPQSADAAALGLEVASDLRVSRWADESVSGDLQTLSFDPQGAAVVSGPGWIKRLGCVNATAAAETIMNTPTGLMGLSITSDGAMVASDGAWAFVPTVDGRLQPSQRQVLMKMHQGEHGAHQLSRGPDGSWYGLAGNEGRWTAPAVDSAHSSLLATRAGKWVRWNADRTQPEIIGDGFRNPYRFDVTDDGDFLTFDSDGERDVSLPTYLQTRVMQMLEGGDHGWLMPGWVRSYALRPESPDRVEVLSMIGRSSPTGVVVYRHNLLPARFKQGVFIADWTFGRILFVPLRRSGSLKLPGASLVAGVPETVLTVSGSEGFAPSDMQVGPDGALYVSIGGRRTRGSVYRIGPAFAPGAAAPVGDPMSQVLSAPQPLSAWSRAQWEPIARTLGVAAFQTAALDSQRGVEARLRAIELGVDLFGGFANDVDVTLASDNEARVRARTAWALGRISARTSSANSFAVDLLTKLSKDDSTLVRQRALTALAEVPHSGQPPSVQSSVQAALHGNIAHPERRVALAAIALAAVVDESVWQAFKQSLATQAVEKKIAGLLATSLRARRQGIKANGLVDEALALWPQARKPNDALAIVRLLQIGLGDFALDKEPLEAFTMYDAAAAVDPAVRASVLAALRPRFPSGNAVLDEEIVRVFAMAKEDDAKTFDRVLATIGTRSSATLDAHTFTALARFEVPAAKVDVNKAAAVASHLANALLGMKTKLGPQAVANLANWDVRLGEALALHLKYQPALGMTLAKHKALPRAENLSIALSLSEPARTLAAQRFLTAATKATKTSPTIEWTESLIDLLSALPRETLAPHLREKGREMGLRDKCVGLLATGPSVVDRPLFVEALSSPSSAVRVLALSALNQLPLPTDKEDLGSELVAQYKWCKRLLDAPADASTRKAVRARIVALASAGDSKAAPIVSESAPLSRNTLRTDHAPFFAWLATVAPTVAAADEDAPVTPEKFLEQLGEVPWKTPDAKHGEELLRQRACLGCHGGSTPMGPALAGVGNRMSREDLLTAIVDPSRDVSALYAATTYETRSGESYTGLITYEAEVVMLRTGATTMVRIPSGDITFRRPADASLMPTGLLDGLGAQDVADLFAHLQSLH
jgi:putative heme-binding domain-containing protein